MTWEWDSARAEQQLVVRPRPSESVSGMFRSWSTSDRSGDVGFSVVDRTSGHARGARDAVRRAAPGPRRDPRVMIGSEHVGQGYGTDAVRRLTDYGFREMGLNRRDPGARVQRSSTRRLRQDRVPGRGCAPGSDFHDGHFHDEVIMSALARDWPHGGTP